MTKKIIFGVVMMTALSCMNLSNSIIASAQISEQTIIEEENTRTSQYVWVYKEVDGIRYMRLWDRTNDIYVTDWIPMD